MKILLIHNYYRYRGGEDRYVAILEDTLTGKGHRVIRFCYDSRDIDQFSFMQKLLIPPRLINYPKLNRELADLVAHQKPDLAVVHNLAPMLSLALLNVLRKKNIPILKRLENYKSLCLNGLFLLNNFQVCERCKKGNFLPGIWRCCYQQSFINSMGLALAEWFHRYRKTLIQNVVRFLATSCFLKSKYIEAGFPGDRIDVYPNFIDFAPLGNLSPASLPGSYAVYIGRLSKEKGLLTLLKTFTELPGLPLKILGSGPLQSELNAFVHERGMKNVEFMGYVDGETKKKILTRARFLIFPSECYESFGYPLIEAAACGIPVIASDSGGSRELVLEGQTGFLFEPGNPVDLRQKITQLLSLRDEDVMTMKEKTLARAKALYTAETGYRNLEHVFKRLGRGDEK